MIAMMQPKESWVAKWQRIGALLSLADRRSEAIDVGTQEG